MVSESENFIEERFSNKVALLDYVSSINEKHEVYEGLLLLQNEEFVKLLDDRDIKAVVKFIAKENKWISATEANEPQPRAVAVPMTAVAFFFVAVVGAVYLAGAAKTVTKTINFSGLDKFYSPIFLPETEIVLRAIAEYAGGEFATKVDKYIIKIATEDIKERYYCNTSENILAF
ncbi:hypothetical protein RV18_GL003272 [Enterococcus termitis]|nr:hypothetical protein RV18_GL003272 [Enterococcus termitis]